MKKLLIIAVMAIVAITANAQKFALIDMDYILKNVPTNNSTKYLRNGRLRWRP